jgi:hypothetical protein
MKGNRLTKMDLLQALQYNVDDLRDDLGEVYKVLRKVEENQRKALDAEYMRGFEEGCAVAPYVKEDWPSGVKTTMNTDPTYRNHPNPKYRVFSVIDPKGDH